MRVALYARYSTDLQNDKSIEDQLRLLRSHAARMGWVVVAEYSDAAESGFSMFRPGAQRMMRDGEAGAFQIILAESLDRFSRGQAGVATFYERMVFASIRVVTTTEGNIGPLEIGFKGTMNSMFLTDLADKTRRGLHGRVAVGRSAGGLSYGYAKVPAPEGQPQGDREIVAGEAAIVRRIFAAYNSGVSPKAIAKRLNAEGIRGPRGATWSPSTLHGNTKRGTGILNNELYAGRIVWNRQRFVKDPATGRRQARLNPRDQWVAVEAPHLQIVDNETWQATKTRQATLVSPARESLVKARRPKHLFSGLTKCGSCGGGFTLASNGRLSCYNAHSRGTCQNRRRIKRQELEDRALRAIRERLFAPGAFDEFCTAFTAEMTRLRREHIAQVAGARGELAKVERRQREIMNALADGYRSEAWKLELAALDERTVELNRKLAEPQLPALHPRMADAFRAKTEALALGLENDAERDAASMALRGLIDQIVIPTGDGLLQVVGNLGKMLAMAQGRALTDSEDVVIVGCGGGI